MFNCHFSITVVGLVPIPILYRRNQRCFPFLGCRVKRPMYTFRFLAAARPDSLCGISAHLQWQTASFETVRDRRETPARECACATRADLDWFSMPQRHLRG